MPNKEGWARIRPNGRRDWHQLRVLGGCLALITLFVAADFYFEHRHRDNLEQNWTSATAVIEDVRSEQMGLVDSP
jgi:hypothetical protein